MERWLLQLIHVIRFASRGGTAKRLENDIFWFKRPSLLLHPVKMVRLVLCSTLCPCRASLSKGNLTVVRRIAGSVLVFIPVVLAGVFGLAIRRRELLLHRHDLAEVLDCSTLLGKQHKPYHPPN